MIREEEEGIIRDFSTREGRYFATEPRFIGPSESDPISPRGGGGVEVHEDPRPPRVPSESTPETIYRSPEILGPTIIAEPRGVKTITGRETRHDLFLQSHPEGVYPTGPGETKATATSPAAKNFLDRFFDWLNKLLAGL